MSLYWRAGLETGDFSEGEYLETKSTDYGGWDGDIDPRCTLTIVQNPVFNGRYAARADVPAAPGSKFVAANLKQSAILENLSEAYYGAALYIPSGFDTEPSGWANIFQLQEDGGAFRIYAYLDAWKTNGSYQIQVCNDWAGGTHYLSSAMTLPRDRWFTVVIYLRGGSNGNIKVWIDGTPWVTNWSQDFSTPQSPGPGFSTGFYGGTTTVPNHVFIDEMRVASTLALATPVPSTPTQHTLSVTSNPSGLPFTLRKTV